MKKQMFQKLFLILLPVMAVGLATTKDSVTVFDQQTAVTSYYSYFDLAPVGGMQILPPLAAILCVLTAILAIICVAGKKQGCLQAAKVTAAASIFAAVGPILLRGDTLVIPNVGLPLIMLVEYVLARVMSRPEKKLGEKDKGIRL